MKHRFRSLFSLLPPSKEPCPAKPSLDRERPINSLINQGISAVMPSGRTALLIKKQEILKRRKQGRKSEREAVSKIGA
jgi:hypothetical protein